MSTYLNDDPDTMIDVIKSAKVIAVIGLTEKEGSASLPVAQYLQEQGYTIIPVNPLKDEVMGLKSYPDLVSVPESIDIVDIFRGARHIPGIVEDAKAAGASTVWVQLGIVNDEAKEAALAASINYAQDTCLKMQHEAVVLLEEE